jgi:hypothetical protein
MIPFTLTTWLVKGKVIPVQAVEALRVVSDHCRSAKLVPTLADRGCHVVSAMSPSDCNFDFLDPEPLLFLPSSSSNCSRGYWKISTSSRTRTGDLPGCSIVPQPTMLPCAPLKLTWTYNKTLVFHYRFVSSFQVLFPVIINKWEKTGSDLWQYIVWQTDSSVSKEHTYCLHL